LLVFLLSAEATLGVFLLQQVAGLDQSGWRFRRRIVSATKNLLKLAEGLPVLFVFFECLRGSASLFLVNQSSCTPVRA